MMRFLRAAPYVISGVFVMGAAPHLAHAAAFKDLTAQIVDVFDAGVIPLLYALGFVFFLIGMARFFFSEGDENRTKGKQFMLYGIIGLAVIFGVWGVVRILLSLIGA